VAGFRNFNAETNAGATAVRLTIAGARRDDVDEHFPLNGILALREGLREGMEIQGA